MSLAVLVQAKANYLVCDIPHGTTATLSISVTLTSPVAAGNTLAVAAKVAPSAFCNTGGGVPSTSSPDVTDDGGNTYTQQCWGDGGVQLQGLGWWLATNVAGGTPTITFHVNVPNANPIFSTSAAVIAIDVLELDAAFVSAAPTVTGTDHQENTVSGGVMNLDVPDHTGATVTTGFASPNQQSGAVLGLTAYGTDYFLAAFTNFADSVPPPAPSITSGYGTYEFADGWSSTGSYSQISTFINAPDVVLCPISQRGNIDYDQIAIDARHGNGPKVQMQDGGTTATGHLASFDHCGNVTDSGMAGSSLPTSSRRIDTTLPLTGGGDLSADRTLAINNFTGDTGSGGLKGAVPAPAAGDAAAGKYLKADGTWAVPPAGSGGATIAATTNLIKGDGAGNGIDSGLAASAVAPLASPTFTGTPAAPTAAPGTNTTQLATTAFVEGEISAAVSGLGTGTVTHSGGALTADLPVFGAGGADIKVGTKTGNTDQVVTATGTATADRPLLYDASGNAVARQPRGNTTIVQLANSTTNPTSGNLAAFDANGNVKDSGIATVSGGGGGLIAPTPPVIRAATLAAATVAGSTVSVSWPTGTIAGDLVYVFQGGFNSLTGAPSGWSLVDTGWLAGPNAQGTVIWRVLNNADITAGSVTLNLTASGTQCVVGAVTIQGQTPGVRTYSSTRNTGTSVTIDTDGSPLTTDLALFFSYARAAVTCSVSLGTALYQVNNGSSASGCLYSYTPAAIGGVSPAFSFTSGSTTYQIALVVKGNGVP